ncbi:hypothetical protein, partial [Catellatospora methionotrophica]|uniref:hypothetical protein n=1 Tax=Catellatospora methionotrophica TaxID=121620 RepID=UPI0019418431
LPGWYVTVKWKFFSARQARSFSRSPFMHGAIWSRVTCLPAASSSAASPDRLQQPPAQGGRAT